MSEQATTKKITTAKKHPFTPDQKAAALKAARQIMNGFHWARTSQGGDYWNDVYINLTEIAGRRPR